MPIITRNLRDGVLYIQDSGASNTLEVTMDAGDVEFAWGADALVIMDRGKLDHLRPGDEVPTTLKFTSKVSKIAADDTSKGGGDTEATPLQALTQDALAVGWSSVGDAGEPYMVDLVFKIANPDSSGRREVITIPYFCVGPVAFNEGEENNTLEFNGLARVPKPIFTWEAQT